MHRIRVPHFAPARFEALGFSPASVLREARLPSSFLQQERLVVTISQWFALWRAIETLSDDPALGLKLGTDIPVDQFDPVFIAALCAGSFHQALLNIARYKQQFCSEELRIVQHADGWHIDAVWTSTHEAVPTFLIDGMFASHMALGQRGSGRSLHPERILLARKPHHRAMYEDHFHCPVEFDADCNLAIYSHQALETPFHTFNPDMLALLLPQLEAQLRDDAAQSTFGAHVKMLLQNRLPSKQPTMQEIADELNISTRTLQRQLAEEATGFQQLLDAARHELARHYLSASVLDLNEIAYLLGYEETSSFHRAFRHWEGVSPGQWRTAHQRSTPLLSS